HEGAQPSDEHLREFCNLGYAETCSRLPRKRPCDAVRFSVARESGSQLFLWFVCEAGHLPGAHGTLEYDVSLARWTCSHDDPRIQKMAECYLESYLLRRVRPAMAGSSSNLNPNVEPSINP